MTGIVPASIAYPNGHHNSTVVRVANPGGLELVHRSLTKNYLPINMKNSRALQLGRFHLSRKRDLIGQCELIRSDILLYPRSRNFVKRGYYS